MKPLRKHLKPFALLLAVTFLVQSCGVYGTVDTYRSKNIELEQAVLKKKQVKVTTTYGQVYKFRKVLKLDGEYVGLMRKRQNSQEVYLSKDEISRIQLFDTGTSIVVNTLICGILLIGNLLLNVFLENLD